VTLGVARRLPAAGCVNAVCRDATRNANKKREQEIQEETTAPKVLFWNAFRKPSRRQCRMKFRSFKIQN
jgi:hypothetical protein